MVSAYIDTETPIKFLEATSWESLTEKQKSYAYFMSKACWEGYKISLFQRSYESPALFLMFQLFFHSDSILSTVRDAVSDLEYKQFMAYASGVYSNSGNYRGFGDTKIVPELPKERFSYILSLASSPLLNSLYVKIQDRIYDLSPFHSSLKMSGTSSYYSPDIKTEEAREISDYLRSHDLSDVLINSRLWKKDNKYTLKIAKVENHPFSIPLEENMQIESNFSAILEKIILNLAQSLPYVDNEYQESMIVEYIKHLSTGKISHHRASQVAWVQDKDPNVETNLGFVEKYSDPLGVRAEFHGFIGLKTPYSLQLLEQSLQILDLLPWKTRNYKAPNFSCLEVLCFASSSIPLGSNIPNYDDIRVETGFKNLSFVNVSPRPKHRFLKEEDALLLETVGEEVEHVTVALHELFGHGNSDIHLENTEIEWTGERNGHVAEESWLGKFGSAYEECKAEAVALYLSCFDLCVQNLQVRKGIWLSMASKGLHGLLYYDPLLKVWTQAHAWARYVILQVLIESGVVSFDNHMITISNEAILDKGFQAISSFIIKLCTFRHTRDKELFEHYSKFDLGKIREILVQRQAPRTCFCQCNLKIVSGKVELVKYSESFEGVIRSFVDRFPSFDPEMLKMWEEEYNVLEFSS